MLKQGVHPKIVQERVGHSSIQVTLDAYSHVAPGLQQAAANKIDDETKIIYDAIYVHSDKGLTQSPFDEVLKDADTFQSWLYNPLVESIGGKRSDRLNKLMAEFGIARDTKLVA